MVLSSLRSLQHLNLGSWTGRLQPVLSTQLLQALTSLTHLEDYTCAVKDLCLLSTCTKPQGLSMGWDGGAMGPAEWASIGQLTQLTWLDLGCKETTATAAMTSAYQQLKRLRHVAAAAWSPEVLPIMGSWPAAHRY